MIFISGPMTGHKDFNYPLFHEVGRKLKDKKKLFYSPAHHWTGKELEPPKPEEAKSWDYYMRRSLKMLLDCDHILMLPGWQESEGAWLERDLAKNLGMKITYYYRGKNEFN